VQTEPFDRLPSGGSTGGYLRIALLMPAKSPLPPIPSEPIMPFAECRLSRAKDHEIQA